MIFVRAGRPILNQVSVDHMEQDSVPYVWNGLRSIRMERTGVPPVGHTASLDSEVYGRGHMCAIARRPAAERQHVTHFRGGDVGCLKGKQLDYVAASVNRGLK